MSEFKIEYNNKTYELNIEYINDYIYKLAIVKYTSSILNTIEEQNSIHPIKCIFEHHYVHIDKLKYILYNLQHYYNVNVKVIYKNFSNELQKNEFHLNLLVKYISDIRYDTVNIYSKFVTNELINFIYEGIRNIGLDDMIEVNNIIKFQKVEYSECLNNNNYMIWLFNKQKEYLIFFKAFLKLVNKIDKPNNKQQIVISKYQKIDQICRPWIIHMLSLEDNYLILKRNIQFLLYVISDIYEN